MCMYIGQRIYIGQCVYMGQCMYIGQCAKRTRWVSEKVTGELHNVLVSIPCMHLYFI